MTKNDFSVDTWLNDIGITSEEQIAEAKKILGTEDVAKNLERGYLRQSDYSRKMNEFDSQKRQYETQVEEYVKSIYDDYTQNLTAAQQEVLSLKQKLNEYGLTPEVEPTPVMPNEPKFDPESLKGTFLDKKAADEAFAAQPKVAAKMYDIASEYEELTGKRFKGMSEFINEALTRGTSLDVLAEEKFRFSSLRETKQAADLAAERARIREEIEMEVRSENHLPTRRPDTVENLMFKHKNINLTSPEKTDSRGSIGAAVNAFNSGQFRRD